VVVVGREVDRDPRLEPGGVAGAQDGGPVRAAGPSAQDPRLAGQVVQAQRAPAGQAVAERDVPSGLAAVLVAAMPLVVVVLRRLAGEPVPRATALGVVAGFAGVAVLVLPGNRTPGAGALGLGIILVATVSMAVASFVSSRLPVPGDTLVAYTA
jgi:drug/metabolite transporter (DMT)-like permease